jgi:hypothetical protein
MRCLAGLLSFAVLALVAPAGAAAAPPASVTMFSESGDYIGGGLQRTFDTGVAGDLVAASVDAGGQSLGVSVSGGPYGDSYGMSFVAPSGPLVPGVYTGAQRSPFREPGRPGMEVTGDGRGCNTLSGNFEVRDLARAADGSVERAWVVYEQHCDGGPALFGEVRVGASAPAGARTAPTLVRWPALDVNGGGQAVPVTVWPAGAITGVSVVGDAADFLLRVDDCTGAATVCEVWVRFVPLTPGTRRAWLRLTDAAGGRTDVPLQGFAYGGETGLTMTSDAGDYIGAGRTWTYGPESRIAGGGSRSGMHFSIDGANGDWWYLDFVPADGDVLAPGTYNGATRYPFNGTGPGLSISGEGRGCNELSGRFTVNELTFSGSALKSVSISFEQHCEHATPALRGTIKVRAGDRTTPAPWMVGGSPPDDPGIPPTTNASPAPSAPPTAPLTPVLGGLSTPAAGPSVASAARRTERSARRLRVAGRLLSPARVGTIRSAANAVATDVRAYRKALGQSGTRAQRAAVKRINSSLRSLRLALTRYEKGQNRRAAKRTIARSIRTIATSARRL